MIIALLILAGMIALNVAVPEPVLEPDSVYPFVNSKISWNQTFYEGPWGDGKLIYKRLSKGYSVERVLEASPE